MSDPEGSVTGTVTLQLGAATVRAEGIVVYQDLPEKHEIYDVLGRLVVEWARLEHALDEIIWKMSNADRLTSACISGQFTSYTARFEAIMALAALHKMSKAVTNNINTLKSKTGQTAKWRNRYIHDAWYNTFKDGEVGQFRSMSPPIENEERTFGIRPITVDEVRKTINEIKRRIDAISKLRNDILSELGASPGTPR
jgi:hypothetical protein